MQDDIAANDRLSLWLSEHQAEMVAESSQEEPPTSAESQAGFGGHQIWNDIRQFQLDSANADSGL